MKAQLIADGRFTRGGKHGAAATVTAGGGDDTTGDDLQATSNNSPNKGKQNSLVTEEVAINNVSMSARNYLTRTATQDEINKVTNFFCLLFK